MSTQPINRVMLLEGKRFALEVAQAAGTSIRNPKVALKIVTDLKRNAAAQPYSYAQGINEVIELLEVPS
ncbi:hypothetical protein FBY06_11583 [Pseudomonas sp. SJZ085]|uniref:hypothetical protein n=1 Tax=unclassified Pseudomonas TaxID=196821 RepID=UPI0011993415|nr:MULTISPECIES: hypothetical protein [unclassified Pseudomonas]TWC18158.1 hypothetical protein FBX99_11583 [Pseudomonas sp. SJZ074]TWC36130.1 hypothetical protein FBY06_11583 [Pseudomonas sp. SJZ085]